MTQPPTLFVCALCKFPQPDAAVGDTSGGQHLIDQLRHGLGHAPGVTLQPVRCMAACDRACNAALSAPGKLTFIFNGLAPRTAASELTHFCAQYAEAPEGKVPYGLRSLAIRQATAYVLPPLAMAPVAESVGKNS